MSSGPHPVPVLVAALLVLVGGITALAVHDDTSRSDSRPVVSMPASPPTAYARSSAPSTTRTPVTPLATAPTTSFVATSVRPNVSSPEAAANGLWAAYTASNRTAAQRFATEDVVHVLFEEPFDGEPGTFLGCRPHDGVFDCRYMQPSTAYAMTVDADAAGSYQVVELTVSPST